MNIFSGSSRIIKIFLFSLMIGFVPFPLWADSPREMNYQGHLSDASGKPRNGNFNMTFRICSDATDTSLATRKFEETLIGVLVINGIFNVRMGASDPAAFANAFLGSGDRWLEVQVGSERLLPRQKLASVPYAINSLSLGGLPYDAYVTTGNVNQTIDGVKTFTNFPVKSGSLTPTLANQFVTKQYVDTDGRAWFLASTNTWTATQSYSNFPNKIGVLKSTAPEQFATKDYVDYSTANILTTVNNWAQPQTFSKLDITAGPLTVQGTNNLTLAGGRLGIGLGAATPSAKLHIGGTPGTDGIKFPDGSFQPSAAGTFGVLYLTEYNNSNPRACPLDWNDAGVSSYYYGVGSLTYMRTCYRTDRACQTMELKQYNNSNPPACPPGWSDAGIGYTTHGGSFNYSRVCYFCQ